MDFLEEKGSFTLCFSCHVLSIICNGHMIPINSFEKIFSVNCLCFKNKQNTRNSTFYEGIITNVQQNKGIYK